MRGINNIIKEGVLNELKDLRIKLIELYVVTITALFFLTAYTRSTLLFYPLIMILLNIIFTALFLMIGANSKKIRQGMNLPTVTPYDPFRETQISYKFEKQDFFSVIVYAIAIFIWLVITVLLKFGLFR